MKDLSADGCKQACSGDPSLACGAPGQLSLYTIDDWSYIIVPKPLLTSSDGKWQSMGCFIDDLTSRNVRMRVASSVWDEGNED
jgi:hypothetical protein